jgi:general secretion pathway protein B
MSLILDALNRAEQERKNQDKIPDFTSVHTTSIDDSSRSKKKFLAITLVAVLTVVVVIVFIFFKARSNDQQQNTIPQRDAIPQQIATVETSNSAIEPVQSVPSPVKESTVTELKVIESPVADSTQDKSIESLYEAENPTAAPVENNLDELYAAETKPESTAIVEPFATIAGAPVDEVVEQPLNLPPPRTFESITDVPDFNQLAWNFKQQIPTISYSRHNYVEYGVRSIVINGQVLGVGNVTNVGQLVIEEIFVDGVIIRYRDTTFKLRALNGWINM